jgi:heptosyltransferase-3
MKPFDLPQHSRILVVTLRRLGDAFFATSLIASLRRAYPRATIDVLLFEDAAGILAGNHDISRIVTMPARPSLWQGLKIAARLAKRYHLAVSTQSGDRPTGFAVIAGWRHVGPVDVGSRGALRRLILSRSVTPQPGLHRLEEMLRIADALGIARVRHLVCPGRGGSPGDVGPAAGERQPDGPQSYAVVHAAPAFAYKRWTPDGWRALVAGIRDRGMRIVATGGSAAVERAYLDQVWGEVPDVLRRDGQMSWPELAAMLAGARLFVGPDTSVTHLAAAAGCPTVALYGPTDPRLWGPVPAGGLDPVWEATGSIQHRKNVWLVQNPLSCLPCQNEGCERRISSFSKCLDDLMPAQVLRAVDAALASQTKPDVEIVGEADIAGHLR